MNFSIDNLGFLISFNMIGTLAIGLISLYIGLYIKNHSKFFNKFGIPAPVIGGILFAVIHLIIRQLGIGTIKYDTTLQDPFMVVFFTTIGIGSSIAALKKGGKLYFEIGHDQGEDVSKLMKDAGFVDVTVKKDLAGLDRVVFGMYNV